MLGGSGLAMHFNSVILCDGEWQSIKAFLFIWVAQAFSDGLEEFASHGVCRGIAVSPRSPRISHLLVADDCFIFMEHNVDHAWCLKWVLDVYRQLAGQKVNFSKSVLFVSPNLCKDDLHALK